MKKRLTKKIVAGMLAGTAALMSGCGQDVKEEMLYMAAVYGPPPDLEQVSPAPESSTTAKQVFDEIMEVQDVYGPPEYFENDAQTADPTPAARQTMDEILDTQYAYGPPPEMIENDIPDELQKAIDEILNYFVNDAKS